MIIWALIRTSCRVQMEAKMMPVILLVQHSLSSHYGLYRQWYWLANLRLQQSNTSRALLLGSCNDERQFSYISNIFETALPDYSIRLERNPTLISNVKVFVGSITSYRLLFPQQHEAQQDRAEKNSTVFAQSLLSLRRSYNPCFAGEIWTNVEIRMRSEQLLEQARQMHTRRRGSRDLFLEFLSCGPFLRVFWGTSPLLCLMNSIEAFAAKWGRRRPWSCWLTHSWRSFSP